MDKAIEILLEAIEDLEAERRKVLFNYRYNWMTSEQKVNLELNIIREVKDIKDAIDVLENA